MCEKVYNVDVDITNLLFDETLEEIDLLIIPPHITEVNSSVKDDACIISRAGPGSEFHIEFRTE